MSKSIFFSAAVLAGAFAFSAMPAKVSADPAPSGDAARGKMLFMKCAACHNVKPGQPNKVGPNLSGVVGRKAGTAAGFNYSAAMKKTNLTWTDANLDKWLTRPATLVPSTSMVFGGITDAKDRKALIAYLKKPN